MSNLHYVFPAAGLGQRFRDIGISTPKPLIEVENVPLIVWAITNFTFSVEDKIWVITLKEHKLRTILSKTYPKLSQRINYCEIDSVTQGPAITVLKVLPKIPDDSPIIIANTDQYVFGDMDSFVTATKNKVAAGTILTMNAKGNQWSYIEKNKFGWVSRVVEKEQISSEATVGIYGFSKKILCQNSIEKSIRNNETVNGEFYIAPVYNHIIRSKQKVLPFLIGDTGIEVMGTGTPTDLEKFSRNENILESSFKIKSHWV